MTKISLETSAPYYVQFYHMIKEMIFEGKYQPGERVNETHLAKEYKVSKSPIREAIRILEKEGLLVVDRAKVVVYQPTLKDVRDIYYCRMALESFAVKLTTKIATDMELKEIKNTLKETETAIQLQKEPNEIILLNEKFHQLILTYSQNIRLQKQVNDLKSLINYFRTLNFKGELRGKEILKQHQKIFCFMEQRDAETASSEMVRHLEMDVNHLINILQEEKID